MVVDSGHAERFVSWLLGEVIAEARGDRYTEAPIGPAGRFWLGRLAPQVKVEHSRLGDRGERLDPCEVGIRLRPSAFDGRTVRCRVRMAAWLKVEGGEDPDAIRWRKTPRIEVAVDIDTPTEIGGFRTAGHDQVGSALAEAGAAGLNGEVHAEVELGKNGPQLVLTFVNVSPEEVPHVDTNLYEVEFEVGMRDTMDFQLDGLPDSFRYRRDVPAYGVNGGVRSIGDGVFVTTDYGVFDKPRMEYWDEENAGPQADLSFARLAANPVEPLRALVDTLRRWIDRFWSEEVLTSRRREERWSDEMFDHARSEAERARDEVVRVEAGLRLLTADAQLRRTVQLANRAFDEAPSVRHRAWRPFQLGFLLANLAALNPATHDRECSIVDTLWFATGGGKTETYLLFTLTAAFHDRLVGKHNGITSWARFPLRMLSLQQTQRFADVFAAAELVRKAEAIAGSEFTIGFLVGKDGSPNRIPVDPKPHEPDPNDPQMPAKYRVLIRCPFCGSSALVMRFDKKRWALDHLCGADGCPWRGRPLPFRIVDDEIYRWLPTVVLGTLDKAANVALQAAMRGFYGPPSGLCPRPGHGFTYAPRSKSPSGCLFPGCNETPAALAQDRSLFAPTIRMQDELHLLRDSLGSIDSHYEALLDGLQAASGSKPKLIASSATLQGHNEQVRALYRREGRMFPLPGPRAGHSFWSRDTDRLARRYIGVAPRGLTLEFANDQLIETLQRAVRRAIDGPDEVAREAGVPREALPGLVWGYGVDVVYGSTLKDVEAAARSFEAQIPIERLNAATLTGRTPLEVVRTTLERLTNPEAGFDDRIHLIAASSMLSHGVDIDRLNIMVMLGLPLSTSEFIQTTSRVGRAHPGLVFVLHKIGRERDAAVFRTFPSFVEHVDRLIDPVPITAKSRRVLELTFPGIVLGRIHGLHEPAALARGLRQLTLPGAVKRAFTRLPVTEDDERQAVVEMLALTGPLDENLRRDLAEAMRLFFRALNDPATTAQWVSDLFAAKPMRSLRDVEEQVPVYSPGGMR